MKTRKERMQSHKWITILKRKPSLLFHGMVVEGQSNQYFKKVFDVDFELKNLIYVTGEGRIDPDEMENLAQLLSKKIEKEPDYFKVVADRVYNKCDKLLSLSKQICDLPNYETFTNTQLKERLEEYIEQTLPIMSTLFAMPVIEKILEKKINFLLKEKFEKEKRKESPELYLKDLIFPRKENFVIKEMDELIKISAKIQNTSFQEIFDKAPEEIKDEIERKDKKLFSELKKHAETYGFLNMYCYEGSPMTIEDIIVRIKELLKENCNEKLKEIEKRKKETEQKYEFLVRTLNLSGEILKFIQLIQEYLYFRLYRLDVLNIAQYYMRDFFVEIGRRMNLTYDDLTYLWHKEIIDFLTTGKKPEVSKIKERKEDFAALLIDGKYEILSGDELAEFKKIEREVKVEPVKELKGTVACPGIHRGVVKLVLSKDDVEKVERGDVIVSTMTNVYYIPAMIKAGAIVTDEGGILSHAAIVSRELNIPCVIGTNIVTKVLKDNDLIEVDAEGEEGVVRILNRSNSFAEIKEG